MSLVLLAQVHFAPRFGAGSGVDDLLIRWPVGCHMVDPGWTGGFHSCIHVPVNNTDGSDLDA